MAVLTSSFGVLVIAALLAYPLVRRFGPVSFALLAIAPACSFFLLAYVSPGVYAGVPLTEEWNWVPELGLQLGLRLDPISNAFALLVSGAGAIVLFYCWKYFAADEVGLARFGATFLAFSASMLGLVLADNVYLLFVFWEATTVFSFLLIGHAGQRRTSRAAALQALIITTLGGLAMLVGLVLLQAVTGSASLSVMLASAPSGALVNVAVYLLLVGALTKSAIFPTHFWLPGAMAAPTPVSAYLHAAAMVKAGIYLIARMAPVFNDVPGFRLTLVLLGGLTMLAGAYRALRQFDLKLVVAYGTVSQLGLLVLVFGLGDPRTQLAGFALLFAHAVAKAPLFLSVGAIDLAAGTRDLRRISGLGRKAPTLLVLTAIPALSLAGMIPLVGFVAKESAFGGLLSVAASDALGVVALSCVIVGSALTAAYMFRFLWGAFAKKRKVSSEAFLRVPTSMLFAIAAFVVFVVMGGVFASGFGAFLEPLVQYSGSVAPEHLSLWHGLTPAFGLSVIVLTAGTIVGAITCRLQLRVPLLPERFSASHIYWVISKGLDEFAVRVTSLTQRGSLPFYLAVILTATVLGVGVTAFSAGIPALTTLSWGSPIQSALALMLVCAAVWALRARTRFQAIVLVGVTGYAMAGLFAFHGAPDLALTQALIETMTLIAFVFVIRRLPKRIGIVGRRPSRVARLLLGVGVGTGIAAVAIIAMSARSAAPISLEFPELALSGGHGMNVVNVTLVDIRGWDTLGELSVILAAATGVASLVFVKTRIDQLPKLTRRAARTRISEHVRRIEDPNDPASRRTWLLAGRDLEPSSRSILLEVVVRLIFHALIVLSLYLLFTGHNSPGGGFAGGLVAGLALVTRYLAGGRHELGATIPIDAGRILGTGLALAVTTAVLPLFFGHSALASSWIDINLGPLGVLPVVTSTFFDIGVYLVVFGLILDVLRSLGAEIDVESERERAQFLRPSKPQHSASQMKDRGAQ